MGNYVRALVFFMGSLFQSLRSHRLHFAIHTHVNRLAFLCCDTIIRDLAIFPFDIHGEAAAGAQALDTACWPGFGHGDCWPLFDAGKKPTAPVCSAYCSNSRVPKSTFLGLPLTVASVTERLSKLTGIAP